MYESHEQRYLIDPLVGVICTLDPTSVREQPWVLEIARVAMRGTMEQHPYEALRFARQAGDFALQTYNDDTKKTVALELIAAAEEINRRGLLTIDDDIATEVFEVLATAACIAPPDEDSGKHVVALWQKYSDMLLDAGKTGLVLRAAYNEQAQAHRNEALTTLTSNYISRLEK